VAKVSLNKLLTLCDDHLMNFRTLFSIQMYSTQSDLSKFSFLCAKKKIAFHLGILIVKTTMSLSF